jgi:hypothetical protein
MNGADDDTSTVDSSLSAHTLTRVNTPVLDNAQLKFGSTSSYFEAGDQWTAPDSEDWNFGSGDFTIDFWMKSTVSSNIYQGLIGQKNTGDSYTPIYIYINNLHTVGVYASYTGSSWAYTLDGGSTTISPNTWYHVAVVVSSGTLKIYVNGILDQTQAGSGTLYNGTGTMKIGNMIHSNFAGWLDEVRISKGIARWTSNFTPPVSEYASGTIAQDFRKSSAKISDLVLISGDQTVAGTKTFSAFPLTPSSAPTADYQVANKKFVDDQLAGLGTTYFTESEIGSFLGTSGADLVGMRDINGTFVATTVEGAIAELDTEKVSAGGTLADLSGGSGTTFLRKDGVWAYPSALEAADGSPSPAVSVDNSGYVGIGTASPIDKFEVVGGIHSSSWALAVKANEVILDELPGTGGEGGIPGQARLLAMGPDASTNGSITLQTRRSNNSNIIDALFISPSGNVGIGTTAPVSGYALTTSGATDGAAGLYVENTSSGTSAAAATRYKNTSSTLAYFGLSGASRSTYGTIGSNVLVAGYTDNTAGATILVDAVGPITFGTSSTERMRIASNGNVGIGITNPEEALDVKQSLNYRTLRLTQSKSDSTAQRVGLVSQSYLAAALPFGLVGGYTDATVNQVVMGYGDASTQASATELQFYTANTKVAGGVRRMTIDKDGNVGIGTTAPYGKFHIFESSNATGTFTVEMINKAASWVGSTFGFKTDLVDGGSLATAWTKQVGVNSNIEIYPENGLLNLNATSVGIGVTNPYAALDINGDISFRKGGYSGVSAIETIDRSAAGIAGDHGLRFSTRQSGSSYARMWIDFNGNVGIGSSDPQYKLDVNGTIRGYGITDSSDIRLKDEIRPLTGSLEKVMALNPVMYVWKDPFKESGNQIGLIAQEVEKLFPELVSTDSDGFKSLNYSHLVAPLAQALQELKTQKDREIASLKDENKKLKEAICSIKEDLPICSE